MSGNRNPFDPRSFAIMKRINSELPEAERVSLAQFKEMMKEQFLIVMQDQERAVGAIPMLLPTTRGERNALMGVIRQLVNSGEALPEESKRRLARIEALFGDPKIKPLPSSAA